MAMPTPNVIVGTTYTLTCDVVPPKIPHAPAGIGGRIGIVQFVGKAIAGNQSSSFPIGIFLHPKMW